MSKHPRAHQNAARTERLLERIVPDPKLHARFVNTLARLEYVGVRKILKSRRAERLDLDGIQHILDEAVHTLRLKKAAAALGQASGVDVGTFAAGATLAGDAAENYLQALDHRAEEALGDLPAAERAEANYLLTSAAVEVRAQVFYPVYDRMLKAHDAGFSVAAITKDEDRHLDEMAAGLQRQSLRLAAPARAAAGRRGGALRALPGRGGRRGRARGAWLSGGGSARATSARSSATSASTAIGCTSRSRSAPSTPTSASRRRAGRSSCGSTKGSRWTTSSARRPSSPTSPPAASPRRRRSPRRPVSRSCFGRSTSSRSSPGSPDGRSNATS